VLSLDQGRPGVGRSGALHGDEFGVALPLDPAPEQGWAYANSLWARALMALRSRTVSVVGERIKRPREELGGAQCDAGLTARHAAAAGASRHLEAAPTASSTLASGDLDLRTSQKVLVVDDEAPLRMLYRFNLERQGIEVVEAGDGPTGLQRAASESPDLILLDVMMPGLDGWRVAGELRKNPETADIPFVFVTPRARPRDRLRGLALGAVDYITLPHNPVELASRVCALLTASPDELEALRCDRVA
jgi:CheY-like chemotaxis protein